MGNYFILGHFGGFNTGDEAMLGGFLSILPATSSALIKYKNGVDVNWGNNVNLFHGNYPDFIESIGPDDTLVLCGGTHFHDDYSPVRLMRHWLYLARINYLFAQAKRKGAKTLCIGNGFGPIKQSITRLLTRQFIELCDVVTVRDQSSARALASMKCQVDVVHPDLAMLLYEPDQFIVKENIVGVSLTSLKSQSANSITDEELVSTLAEELSAFSLTNQHEVLIRLFVIRSGDRESDAPITRELHKRLLNNNVRSEIYEFTNDLNGLLEKMRPCKVFLASRFHSAVLGAVTQNRLIILSYHTKLVSLAEELKMDSRFVMNLQQADADKQLTGLSAVVSELYTANQLNYSFPEAEISRLGEQIHAIYEEGVNFRIHADLRRASQPSESVTLATTGARI